MSHNVLLDNNTLHSRYCIPHAKYADVQASSTCNFASFAMRSRSSDSHTVRTSRHNKFVCRVTQLSGSLVASIHFILQPYDEEKYKYIWCNHVGLRFRNNMDKTNS